MYLKILFSIAFSYSILNVPQVHSNTKILIVNSYSDSFYWTRSILQSFKGSLRNNRIKASYTEFSLDAKQNPIPLKDEHPLIKEIDKLIDNNKPSLVFITDDYALNQLADTLIKHRLSFIFAGLNGEVPTKLISTGLKYSGVLERYYVSDSIKLLKRLLKKTSLKLVMLLEDSETSEKVRSYALTQIKPLRGVSVDFVVSNDFDEWKKVILNNPKKYDGFLPFQPFALKQNGNYVNPEVVVNWIYENSNIPSVYTAGWEIKCGGTLAISHKPEAQGQMGAGLVIKALQNVYPPPSSPPVGDIEINHASTNKLKISIPFDLLTSATIHKKIQSPCSP